MIEATSVGPTILDRPRMLYQPFGIDHAENKIRDVSGLIVSAMVTWLESKIGGNSVEELCDLLNARIPDPIYHVSPKFLKSVWNSYSYEFSMYLREFCEQLSADRDFHFKIGQWYLDQHVLILMRPFTMAQIARMLPRICKKFTPNVRVEVDQVSRGFAAFRLGMTDHALEQFGPYRERCWWMIIQAFKGAANYLPVKLLGQPAAHVVDRHIENEEGEWCEIRVSWSENYQGLWRGWTVAALSAGILFTGLRIRYPIVTIGETLILAGLPILLYYLGLSKRRDLSSLVREQEETVNTRHEELREVYIEQEHASVELRRKVFELTALRDELQRLNESLENKVSERTADLVAANTKLRELDQVRSRFLAHVSHELRTPLTSMVGFTENLLDGLLGGVNPKQGHALNRMIANATRLRRMIDNLLDQSAIEVGQPHLAITEVSLGTVIAEVVEELTPLVKEKNHRVTFTYEGEIWVLADPDKLQQIVINILANAVKYTAHGGSITVEVFSTGGMANITISDTGEGIPPDQISRLFDPFFRVQQAGTTRVKGLGLGLAIAKEFVQLQGGSIDVQSELGKGTTFVFSVPLASPPPITTTMSTEAAILIVDDDSDIRETLSDRLRAWDFRVLTVDTGREALAALDTEDVKGVLLDIGMPGMDGIEVLTSMRDCHPSIPVILITAAASEARAASAIASGAQGYLLKPISASRLQQTVERWFTSVSLSAKPR
ncbi:MAG: protein of unknown function, putative Histidine kinase [Nitrospira sp.]|jgi:signal transduction histidine kinase/ActR/RegA family two-component response regulator|nr:protein of unknown function, putative Histidine kinase [Nitrospira sp.]